MQVTREQPTAVTAVPVRTCIGCRATDSRGSLLRVAVRNSAAGVPVAFFDTAKRASGRGAWVHQNPTCLAAALKKGAFNRAFRTRVDTDELTSSPLDQLVSKT